MDSVEVRLTVKYCLNPFEGLENGHNMLHCGD